MTLVTIGSRFQVVIPKQERQRLNLKPNTKVAVEARDNHLVLYPVGQETLRGLGKEMADGENAGDYVKRLRSEWGRKP